MRRRVYWFIHEERSGPRTLRPAQSKDLLFSRFALDFVIKRFFGRLKRKMASMPPIPGRTYRVKAGSRLFVILYLVFAAIIAIVAFGRPLLGWADPQPEVMIVSVVLLIVGILFVGYFFSSAIVFTIDAIELHTLTGRQSLPLDAIRGRREYVVRGGEEGDYHGIKLEFNDDRFPLLDSQRHFNFDEDFWRWFNQLPDLDVEDKKKKKTSNFGLV